MRSLYFLVKSFQSQDEGFLDPRNYHMVLYPGPPAGSTKRARVTVESSCLFSHLVLQWLKGTLAAVGALLTAHTQQTFAERRCMNVYINLPAFSILNAKELD